MIICAAVKFHVHATDRDVVIAGQRHGSCFSVMVDIGLTPHRDFSEIEQGFLTDFGVFVNRKEAYAHALGCGQLSAVVRQMKHDKGEIELFSEDLY